MIWYHFPKPAHDQVRRKGTKMLIKFEASNELADSLKIQYGQRVASKAFYEAACDSIHLARELKNLKTQLQEANRIIAVQRQTLEGARAAAAQLLEKVAQGDLIDA